MDKNKFTGILTRAVDGGLAHVAAVAAELVDRERGWEVHAKEGLVSVGRILENYQQRLDREGDNGVQTMGLRESVQSLKAVKSDLQLIHATSAEHHIYASISRGKLAACIIGKAGNAS